MIVVFIKSGPITGQEAMWSSVLFYIFRIKGDDIMKPFSSLQNKTVGGQNVKWKSAHGGGGGLPVSHILMDCFHSSHAYF